MSASCHSENHGKMKKKPERENGNCSSCTKVKLVEIFYPVIKRCYEYVIMIYYASHVQ